MKKTPRNIRVIATKITGGLHLAKQKPCQDFYQYACSGNKLVAVVSDGAGSAKYGKIGAKIVCETLVNVLINTPLKNVEEAVAKAIQMARGQLVIHRLNKSKSEAEILNFSATVVGVAYHNNRGVFFHIGDGAALAFVAEDFSQYVASRPENGVFACETYFYTMDDWQETLRFTPFRQAHTLMLMSDGLTNFSFTPDFSRIEPKFLLPINDFLNREKQQARAVRALTNTFNTVRAKKLNPDDKTFLWARL